MIRYGLLAIAAAASVQVAQSGPPADLSELVAKAGVQGTLATWCSGDVRLRGHMGYAAAVMSSNRGGRYLVYEAGETVVELATFNGAPEVACYTSAEARKINESIRRSETISGKVAPMFETTVVCGFVEDTTAMCWQYSPKTRAFIKVGEWQT